MKINYSKIFDELFPINRSLLGEGYNKSLKILAKYINFKYFKYGSGSKIFDWKVPKEWVVKEAFIEFKSKKILDYKKSNLHLVSYSTKVNTKLNQKDLKSKIYSLPSLPSKIPYVTSYYKKNWGYCASHNFKKNLKKGTYNCVINTKFKNSNLVNGYAEIKGKSKKMNLLTSYLCHPSLANNELSGPLVMIGLYDAIKKWKKRNYKYNFLINPETIGSLCFLKSHGQKIQKIFNSGLVLTCLGGNKKKLSYKLSKNGNSTLDKIFSLFKDDFINIRKFDPAEGSDERQFNSPGFNLPVGNICRSVYGQYSQYHNSGDDKKFMNISKIKDSIIKLNYILELHDLTLPLKRYMPYGELMLGKRNLYPNENSESTRKKSSDNINDGGEQLKILLQILSYSDGLNNILDIIEKNNLNKKKSFDVLKKCLDLKLIYFKS